jgi:hypothetical protein
MWYLETKQGCISWAGRAREAAEFISFPLTFGMYFPLRFLLCFSSKFKNTKINLFGGQNDISWQQKRKGEPLIQNDSDELYIQTPLLGSLGFVVQVT